MRTILIALMSLMSLTAWAGGGGIDSLLRVLDNDILHYSQYDKIKEEKLERLKKRLPEVEDFAEKYNLHMAIYDEYSKYSSDSALHYLNENAILARQAGDFEKETDVLLEEAYILICVGMYLEADGILKRIERDRLSPPLLGKYYKYCKRLYSETSSSKPINNITSPEYRKLSKVYRDSLFMVLPKNDDICLQEQMFSASSRKDYEEALRFNDLRMECTTFGDPMFALVAYDRFQILNSCGRKDEGLRYLVLSAISDVRSSIKEQASMLQLAKILYNKGDIERANTYINYSWQVSEFYNTRMRSWRHITPYTMISTGFQDTINRQNNQLQNYLLLIIVLSAILGCTVIYLYRQMKRLRLAKAELAQLNENLNITNAELSESNKIKEVYIARFFKLCSTYVNKSHSFRNMVNKKLHKGAVEELLKITSPANETSFNERQELYAQFDEAFLKIFPNFVNSVNELLRPEERIVLKENEFLNPELRICALIRLGFVKPAQIAEMMYYSPTTVYNYRTKLRDKAKSRDEFEDLVAQISR